MELKALFRQFWKIALLTVLMVVLLSFTYFFYLTQHIASENVSYVKSHYSCIGTVIPADTTGKKAYQINTADIPETVIKTLSDSKWVSRLDARQCVSGKMDEYQNILWYYFSFDANFLVLFEATVDESPLRIPVGDAVQIDIKIKDLSIYASHPDTGEALAYLKENKTTWVHIITDQDSPYLKTWTNLEPGKRYLFLASLHRDTTSGKPATSFLVEAVSQDHDAWPYLHDNLLPHLITPIPERTEVIAILSELGFSAYVSQAEEVAHLYSVRTVKDMDLMLPVNDGEMLIDGRLLNVSDVGKKVCVISSELAQKYGLRIGDAIPLRLAERGYLSSYNYRQGIPAFGQLVEYNYAEAESYTIIGTYAFRKYSGNLYQCSYNDIFIPPDSAELRTSVPCQPYSFSFEVMGENYDAFMESTAKEISRLGYTVKLSDDSWKEVESLYRSMTIRQHTSGMAFLVMTLVCCIISVLTLVQLYRKDYALRNLLGASWLRSGVAYLLPFLISSLFSFPAVIIFVLRIYRSMIVSRMKDILPDYLVPSNGTVLLLLLQISLVIIAFDLLVLLCISLCQRQRSARSLINN